jgi:hypothetical protein
MSFWGAILILNKAKERHLVQGSLVSKTNMINYLFRV